MTRLGKMLREEEKYQNLISKILKKIQKNCSVSEMAEMLEEDEETVQKIYDIVVAQGAKCDEEQIYREFMQHKKAGD